MIVLAARTLYIETAASPLASREDAADRVRHPYRRPRQSVPHSSPHASGQLPTHPAPTAIVLPNRPTRAELERRAGRR